MLQAASRIATLWIGRKSRDTPVRRHACASVAPLRRAVVITGGSRGIGLAFARKFLEHGHTVVLVARSNDRLAAAVASIDARVRERCLTIACDVAAPDAPSVIENELQRLSCCLDVLVNSAGIGLSGPFTQQTKEQLDQLIAVNIGGLTRLTRHALQAMCVRGEGGIISIASLGGYVPGPNQAAYYASKAYVLSLTEALASETAGLGVRICAIAPGPTGTPFHADMGAAGANYRLLLPELSADHVARSGYRGFILGQRVVVPGIFYRLVFLTLRVLPHPVSVPITGWLLKKSTRTP